MTYDELQSSLSELALDLRWSWNHAADEIWSAVDAELWDLTHNPWVILQTVSRRQLEKLAVDPAFSTRVNQLVRETRDFQASDAWFQQAHAGAALSTVAYFSMEFMLSEALPIYSGGLGNVAGDQLKAASDLGVPVVGVGLLYQKGYFRQEIDASGTQQALYPVNDSGQLPVRPVRDADGEWLRLKLALPGFDLWIRTWEVRVGRTKLYLLDTNDPANLPHYRGITSELYGGGPELRLRQELVLGMGGWRLLRALHLTPEVCHLNEGHAAFVVLERARCHMEEHHQPFDLALAITRAGNVFTTHTPVDVGFDRFSPALVDQYFRGYAESDLGIPLEELMALGRHDPSDASEPFNMAYLAMRGSATVNGVSKLHGEVSRKIFQPLFPRWPRTEVPVSHVTNGVHAPSWDSIWADQLWTSACGKERWRGELKAVSDELEHVPDEGIWRMRMEQRRCLVDCVRKHLSRQMASRAAPREELALAQNLFDPNVLTIGFARRFASYKRSNLLLSDPQRLIQILTSTERPVQLVLAGKAHPADPTGKAMIREWMEFVRRPEVRRHTVFLSDYDMLLAEILVQGVDVWINTPRRPWEACGTSGMKVLVNGGLNLSELDGWWAEAYSPEVGWALGDGKEHDEDATWDAAEAAQLYSLLEDQVIPEFYARDPRGIPPAWVHRIRQSMMRLTPAFSSNRTVREYTEGYYLPAAASFARRARDGGKLGSAILSWRRHVTHHWPSLRFGQLKVSEQAGQWRFELQVYLDEIDLEAVSVELYAEGRDGDSGVRLAMQRGASLVGSANGFVYTAEVPADRPASDFTPRIVPHHPEASVPMEANEVLWQH